MRTIGLIAVTMLLVGVAGCMETRTPPHDQAIRGDSNAATAVDASPPAPAAFPPHEPRPLLNR